MRYVGDITSEIKGVNSQKDRKRVFQNEILGLCSWVNSTLRPIESGKLWSVRGFSKLVTPEAVNRKQ